MEPLYTLRGVTKFFQRGPTTVRALDGIDLEIAAGEFVALEGPSGSGKTTLLQLLGALDRPSGGDVRFDSRPGSTLPRHPGMPGARIPLGESGRREGWGEGTRQLPPSGRWHRRGEGATGFPRGSYSRCRLRPARAT